MNKENRILVGKIRSSHGVRGLVKFDFYGEGPDLLKETPLYSSQNSSEEIYINLKNKHKTYWLAEIKGVSDKNTSDTYRGTELYIDRDHLPAIDEDEHYHVDLIGMKVLDKNEETLGEIIAISNFGASDLIEVKAKGQDSFFVPYTDAYVLEIDDKKGFIRIEEFDFI